MRYIRTKYGEIHEFLEEGINNAIISAKGCVIMKYAIVKQAETIEELCDEFVLVAEDYDYFQTTRKITRKWVFDDLADTEQKEEEIGKGISRTIYGAIWTEKGLIFVAKVKGVSQNCEISWELL